MKLLDKLIKALESGEYKQGFEALCNYDNKKPTGYCCLGVATHLHNPDHEMLAADGTTSIGFYLPVDVKELIERQEPKAKFSKSTTGVEWDMYVKTKPEASEPDILLSTLNDNGRSFKEIADCIRMTYR